MRNATLCQAMSEAGYTDEKLAEAAGVDPKTVWRWRNQATPPRRAELRLVVSDLLDTDPAELWPVHGGPDQPPEHDSTGEIVAAWAYRADVPKHRWWTLLSAATETIDLLAYAMLFLPEDHARLDELLIDKAQAGCRVRIALGDPDSEHVAERDEEEGAGHTMPGRIRTTLSHFRTLRDIEGIELRLHRTRMYNSVFRADTEMFVTPHLYATTGYRAPILLLRRSGPGGMFDNFAGHFERVWSSGEPIPSP